MTVNASLVHDHPSNGCLVLILEGELTEDFYIKSDHKTYQYYGQRINKLCDVSYMEKDQIVHRISNSSGNKSISLHVYSPPKFKHTAIHF